ncbi:MAG: tetratricopeptide repeat protein [Acidobacteria bacterium]|nr:tetratricopeptide repeat protein [Acidobacteriota bacterium]
MAQRTSETVYLCLPDGDQVYYADQINSRYQIRPRDWSGSRVPMYTVSAGKLFLADLSPLELDTYLARPLEPFARKTMKSAAALRAHLKEVRKKRPEKARQHFHQAVAQYDQYAAAWNALGRIYLAGRQIEKATRAFEKAIGIDPEYIPPYVNLATLQLQKKQYQRAVETAGKALRRDPSVGFASFLQAVGNYNLNNLDAAEKCARRAEANPRGHLPQLHVLLAEIFLQRQAHLNAAVEIRTYLKESPEGRFAGQMRERLEQIKQFIAQK